MKLYRVEYRNEDDDTHEGYSYHPSKKDAQIACKCSYGHTIITQIEVATDKKGIIRALNQYTGHPDNG